MLELLADLRDDGDPIEQALADLAELAAETRFISLAAIADRWHGWLDAEAGL